MVPKAKEVKMGLLDFLQGIQDDLERKLREEKPSAEFNAMMRRMREDDARGARKRMDSANQYARDLRSGKVSRPSDEGKPGSVG